MHFDLLQNIGGALIALLVVVVAGWFAIVRIRRWMRAEVDESKPFTLEDLRRLHRDGQLSDEEFQKARDAMITAVKRVPQPGTEPEGRSPRDSSKQATFSRAQKADPSVDFGIRAEGYAPESKRTHPPRPPKRPPQLGG